MVDLNEYERRGDLDAPIAPTMAQVRRQKERERIWEAISRQTANAPKKLSPAQTTRLGLIMGRALVNSPDPHELMRWRLRLFCGHIVEDTSRVEHTDVDSAFAESRRCPECGREPVIIVDAEAIGIAGDPPEPDASAP